MNSLYRLYVILEFIPVHVNVLTMYAALDVLAYNDIQDIVFLYYYFFQSTSLQKNLFRYRIFLKENSKDIFVCFQEREHDMNITYK